VTRRSMRVPVAISSAGILTLVPMSRKPIAREIETPEVTSNCSRLGGPGSAQANLNIAKSPRAAGKTS